VDTTAVAAEIAALRTDNRKLALAGGALAACVAGAIDNTMLGRENAAEFCRTSAVQHLFKHSPLQIWDWQHDRW
jgi:hypothetical protein